MVKAAAERGWIDGDAVALEHLTAIKRAGADVDPHLLRHATLAEALAVTDVDATHDAVRARPAASSPAA